MPISTALRVMLDEVIDSHEKLRFIVLLLHADARRCTIESIADALDLSRDDVRQLAAELRRGGLAIDESDHDVALPEQPRAEVTELLLELGNLYRDDLGVLAVELANTAIERLRELVSRVPVLLRPTSSIQGTAGLVSSRERRTTELCNEQNAEHRCTRESGHDGEHQCLTAPSLISWS
jgi:biotin operon repressor